MTLIHVVLFRPRPGLPSAARAALLSSLTAAARDIPSIKRLRAGRRFRHGRPGYEQGMAEDYEYALIVEFDDADGLARYLAHPAHAALARHFTESAGAALAYDYEVVEGDDLTSIGWDR
ncbi:MAG TPA: Dabb family protein [Vicinamibacterales bacterium]|nr:Dabb family protein [Vicinamibacterales bacterium]